MNASRFPKQHRLRRNQEFARVYAGKCRAGDDRLLLFAARREGATRLG